MLLLGCVFHECILVVYAFVMHVNVYTLLCMHCHGYGYACTVGQICVMRSLHIVYVIMMLLVCYDVNMLVEMKQEMQIIKARLQH